MSKICTYFCDYCGHVSSRPTCSDWVVLSIETTQLVEGQDRPITKELDFCCSECRAAWVKKHTA